MSAKILVPSLDLILRSFGIEPPKERKPTVVVVGYGWGGKSFCEFIDRKKYNINIDKKS